MIDPNHGTSLRRGEIGGDMSSMMSSTATLRLYTHVPPGVLFSGSRDNLTAEEPSRRQSARKWGFSSGDAMNVKKVLEVRYCGRWGCVRGEELRVD